MIKIEKSKAIEIVLKIERVIDMWRRNRVTVLFLVAVIIFGVVLMDGRKNNAVGVSAENDTGRVLPAEQANLSDNVPAEASGESFDFAGMFANLAGGGGALSSFRQSGEAEHEGIVLKVPAEFDTIQKAIDMAMAGDVVEVAAGEYRENLVMKNGVSVIGERAETTILDGDKKGNVVTFKDLNDGETRLENFSIKNAQESLSGVLVENSSPIINRNIIFSNDYDIYIKGHSSPIVQRNVLEQSKVGVQIFNLDKVEDSNPSIADNLIYANKKGINLYNSKASIDHNTVSFNGSYDFEAGATFGIYLAKSGAVITNNIITDNGTCEICSGVYADENSKDVKLSFNDIWNNQNNFVCFGVCSMEDNNRSEDPLYENGLLFSFSLKAESTLFTAGSDGQKLGARI